MTHHVNPRVDASSNFRPPTLPAGVLVSAGSVGGLHAISTLVASLPRSFPVPVVVVQQRSPNAPSLLPKLLARLTPLHVKLGHEGELLEAGTIYVAPSDVRVRIAGDGTLQFSEGQKINLVRSSASPLLESAAHTPGPGVIAVVLSGSGSNDTDYMQAVKREGGTVIAQDQATSERFEMPASAISTGAVDYVLPLEKIGPFVVDLVKKSAR